MNLKQVYKNLTKNDNEALEFQEFEELMNNWAWEEFDRQYSNSNIAIKNILDKNLEGF